MTTQEKSAPAPHHAPHVEIREMELEDLAEVFHLGERLFTAEEVPNLHRTWDEYEVTDFFQGEPELCLVAEHEDHIVGFAMGTTIDKRRSAWKYGHLVWLGVDPDHARHGLGARLFRWLRQRMEDDGVRMIIVDTEADNEGALAFFRDLGFGHPKEHVYLSLNLSHSKAVNGNNGSAKAANGSNGSAKAATSPAPQEKEPEPK